MNTQEKKQEILDLINHSDLSEADKFNQLFSFYQKHPARIRNIEYFFNRVGYNSSTYSKIIYEVQKIYGISEVEILTHVQPVYSEKCESCQPAKSIFTDTSNPAAAFTPAEENTYQIREPWNFCETPEEKCNMNFCDENGCQNRTRVLVNELDNSVINQEKESSDSDQKLRSEFTFLDTEDCPNELKILVADRITTYKKITEVRGFLEDPTTTEEDRKALAEAAVKLDEANDLIWKELNHYQDHKEILGEHPIFDELRLKRKVEGYTKPEKVQRAESIKNQIRAQKMQLGKANKATPIDADKILSIEKKISLLELEHKLVLDSL